RGDGAGRGGQWRRGPGRRRPHLRRCAGGPVGAAADRSAIGGGRRGVQWGDRCGGRRARRRVTRRCRGGGGARAVGRRRGDRDGSIGASGVTAQDVSPSGSGPEDSRGNGEFRSGFVCLVGRPNTGKSTLTNALVGAKVAITSNRPQTTRHTIRGIVHRENFQIVLVDTP